MTKPLRKFHIILNPMNSSLVDLPAPLNLSSMWNFGSLLGLCLSIQIITGLLLSMHYSPHIDMAFSSISHAVRDVNWGWTLRSFHANGASMFFICMYLHMARSLYFGSYKMKETWNLGVTIFILTMATAFMGYLLPWGQMSFWGATVITNLFSALPYMGPMLVEWIWGGFGVNNATLTRFFSLHFILPMFIAVLAGAHLIFIHSTGSNNPLGISANTFKIPFHTHYSAKDMVGFMVIMIILTNISFFYPNLLSEPDNFIPANPLITPTHIKPEWYFLWAYAILRSIPNKLGGVVIMFSAILMLYLPSMTPTVQMSTAFCSLKQMLTWILCSTVILLTWIGGSPVEPPFDYMGKILTFLFFLSFILLFKPQKI